MVYLMIYFMVSILSFLFIHSHSKQLPQELLILVCSSLSVAFFSLINYGSIRHTYSKLLKIRWLYFCLMVSIFIIWLSTFIGITAISPTFFMFVIMTMGAMYGAVFNWQASPSKINLTILLLIIIAIGCFFYYIILSYHWIKTIKLFIFIVVVGCADYIYAATSFKIAHQLKITSSQIVAARFWLMNISLLTLVLIKQGTNHENYIIYLLNLKNIGGVLLITIFSFIIPMYCYQKSVLILGSNDALLFCSVLPCLMYLTEVFLKMNTETSPQLGFITYFLVLPVVLRIWSKWISPRFIDYNANR